jgi:hypothetical protein
MLFTIPWFKFQILKKTRSSPCFTLVASIFDALYPCWLYTPIVKSMILVETITVVSGGMSISRRGFYAVTKLFFIRLTTNFYATSVQITFYASWLLFQCIQSVITCHDSNFKFMNFKIFQKRYSKWTLNRAQKCQEFNGKNRFLIGYLVEELLWKNRRD